MDFVGEERMDAASTVQWLGDAAGRGHDLAIVAVGLSMSDGHAAIAPHGVEVRLTDRAARDILLVTGCTWAVGLASAVGDLVAWTRPDVSPRRKNLIAAADLVVMVLLIVIAGVVIGAASTMTA